MGPIGQLIKYEDSSIAAKTLLQNMEKYKQWAADQQQSEESARKGGAGRMEEPANIVKILDEGLKKKAQ